MIHSNKPPERQREVLSKICEIIDRVDYFICNRSGTHRGLLNATAKFWNLDLPKCNYFGVTEAEAFMSNYERENNEQRYALDLLEDFHKNVLSYGDEVYKAIGTVERLEELLERTGSVSEIYSEMKRKSEESKISFFRSQIPDTPEDISYAKLSGHQGFDGLTVVVTGVFDNYPYRKDLENLIRENGGKLVSSISKNVNMVVVGQGAGPSKLKKIQQLQDEGVDIKMINESELEKLL